MADLTALFKLQGEGEVESSPPAPLLQRLADTTAQREKQVTAIYQQYQENIKKSEIQKGEMLKNLAKIEEMCVYSMLVTSLECIGRMTNDTVFLKQAKEQMEKKIELVLMERETRWTQVEEAKTLVESGQSKGIILEKLELIQEKIINS